MRGLYGERMKQIDTAEEAYRRSALTRATGLGDVCRCWSDSASPLFTANGLAFVARRVDRAPFHRQPGAAM